MKKTTGLPDPLKKIESRLRHVEEMLQEALANRRWQPRRIEAPETPVEPWRFLVRQAHPWRKQLYVKVRNLTARQLVGSIKANQFNDEKAAANFHLPIDVIGEALAYVEKNSEFLPTEAEIERLWQASPDDEGNMP